MSAYDELPRSVSVKISSFRVAISHSDLEHMQTLIRCAKLGPLTFENLHPEGKYHLTYDWVSKAKKYWQESFDWHAVQNRVNEYGHFISQITDDDDTIHPVHFVALFSQKKDAIPLMCIHGWAGSFLEFIGLLSTLRGRYAPDQLPYHVIVPSLPGYAFSAPPPAEKDWTLQDSARIMHKLMVGLGFGDGYALQGGDIGSSTARIMASLYDSCKALHLKLCSMTCPGSQSRAIYQDYEHNGLKRADDFTKRGVAYALEHTTSPPTTCFVPSSSPVALLAWVGEKYLCWSDDTPPMDDILALVSLYWLTETFRRAIYPYNQEMVEEQPTTMTHGDCRNVFRQGFKRHMLHPDPDYYCHKPMGYSWFAFEIAPMLRSWAETRGNLVWFRHHEKGGHFAALEQAETLLEDVEGFLKQVWVPANLPLERLRALGPQEMCEQWTPGD